MTQEDRSKICKNCKTKNGLYEIYCSNCDNLLEDDAQLTTAATTPSTPATASRITSVLEVPQTQAKPIQRTKPLRFVRWSPLRLPVSFKRKNLWWLLLLGVLLITLFPFASFIHTHWPIGNPAVTPTPNFLQHIGENGIGVTTVNGEEIGISDGGFSLDTNQRAGTSYKIAAAAAFKVGNLGPAEAGWNSAVGVDNNDAESLIYLENLKVKDSGAPHITFILGVLLGTKAPDALSRANLQGAYVAQKEYNDRARQLNKPQIRLLIAKSGSDPDRSADIAMQIVKAASYDKTIVGVLGWTTTVTTLNALPILSLAHIPMIGPATTGDGLTNKSPYFFRVAAPNQAQASLLDSYIEAKLKPQRLLLFKDSHEPYSQTLADDFEQKFTAHDKHIFQKVEFTTNASDALKKQVENVVNADNPDVIFFTSYSIGDMVALLKAIPQTPQFAGLKVVLGTAGYQLTEANQSFPGYTRVLFAAGSFPDIWGILASGKPVPDFFKDFITDFDPNNKHMDSPYTYRRPNSYDMLGYDAMSTFLKGSDIAFESSPQGFTSDQLRTALAHITGANALQGVTGMISLGADSNPTNKIISILHVDEHGYLQMDGYQGCLLVTANCDDKIVLLR